MTVSLRIKNNKFYAVASFKDGKEYKQKWIALKLPVKNNKRKAEEMLNEIRQSFESKYLSVPVAEIMFVDYIKKWLDSKFGLVEFPLGRAMKYTPLAI